MSTTPQNYYGLDYQKGKFYKNHKKMDGPREDQEKDRVFIIKDSIPEYKDLIPWVHDSILSIENDKNSNQSGKKNYKANIP